MLRLGRGRYRRVQFLSQSVTLAKPAKNSVLYALHGAQLRHCVNAVVVDVEVVTRSCADSHSLECVADAQRVLRWVSCQCRFCWAAGEAQKWLSRF